MYDPTLKYSPEYARGMTPSELDQLMLDAKSVGLALRMESQVKHPDRPHLFKKIRRDIARFKTIRRSL